jgi:hypothetical protein
MIKVVNMIPQSLSGETNQDSEPNIAVNPANPLQIAGSAFTPNPMGGGSANAPIYVSIDGGVTWTLNNIVPSSGSLGTGDITLKFAGTSGRLFATILDGTTGAFEVHRTTNFTAATPMTQLESRGNEDQPYVQAATVMGGADVGKDRVYIGVNDFNAPGGKTATIEQTLDAGLAAPTFSSIRVEKRTTLGQNGPQVRPAIHADGTVYAAFYRWISSTGNFGANTLVITNAELIVVRDDNWGTGATPFTALTDPSDSLAGRRVATGLSFPFNQTGVAANGQERWGGDVSITVDPRNSSTIYVAHSTLVSGVYTLRILRSLDSGVTWSAVLLSISNAKNPALAINSLGKIGLAYQQFTGSGATQKWETHFRSSTNGTTWAAADDNILCTALSQSPARTFSPYIGDYIHMMAMGKDFYGVFSANNTPDLANFPQGVTYQRNHDFPSKKLFALNNVTVINPSIDPFFFKVTEIDNNAHSDFYVRDWTTTAAVHDTGLEPSTSPWFYVGSDVWNQRSNVAPTFINDVPQNEDPQNNATNYAFARISRNTSGIVETVNADFFVAEFGTGSPFVLVGSTTVNFAAADTVKIITVPWVLGITTSTHLCLAVQISTAADPFIVPGLNGKTPGWPTTDLIVINDNNKAQRNMSVHYGLSPFGSSHYGIIRNASLKVRDFNLALKVDPTVLRSYKNPLIQLQGGDKTKLSAENKLIAKAMNPGESRWFAFSFDSFDTSNVKDLPIDALEVVDGKVVNGFRISIQAAPAVKALTELLLRNINVFQRVGAIYKITSTDAIVKATRAQLKVPRLTTDAYVKFMSSIIGPVTDAVQQFLKNPKNDPGLDVSSTLQALTKAAANANGGDCYSNHTTLLNKLDVAASLGNKTLIFGKAKPSKAKAKKKKK